MRRLLLLFTILQFINCNCPDGYNPVRNGECRGYYETFSLLAYNVATDKAIASCNEIKTPLNEVHGQPVIIHDVIDDNYWTGLINWIILGLVCNTTSKKWQWADGSVLDYKPASGSSLSDDCATGCVWYTYGKNSWSKNCGSSTNSFYIYCTLQMHQPVIHAEGCNSFEDDSDDGVCYQIGETAENWQDAQLNCKKVGANLASIHNTNENSFIRRLAVSKLAVEGVFIGATVAGKSGSFGWIDGSDWDYDNYAPGFPRSGFGDCLVLDTSTSAGQWMNTDCSVQMPVACSRDLKTPIERNITCSAETYMGEGLITSPGFPFNATMPCEYYLQVEAGKRVEVEIYLEANTCCDFLAVHDGYIGDTLLGNFTGEIRNRTYTTTSSNIMKVQWQPNGGVNVRGMAMTFRGV